MVLWGWVVKWQGPTDIKFGRSRASGQVPSRAVSNDGSTLEAHADRTLTGSSPFQGIFDKPIMIIIWPGVQIG